MPKGLKSTSGQIIISGRVIEAGAATYTEERIDLQLNVLDREVFVVQAVDLNLDLPEIFANGDDTSVNGCLSTVSRNTIGTIADSNVFASQVNLCEGNNTGNYVLSTSKSMETPPTNMEYIGIIATNDFYAAVEGSALVSNPRTLDFRVWGYRATADAATYAALTQSELLSQS